MAVPVRAPVWIGDVVRNGVAFDPKNWGAGRVSPDELPGDVRDLLALLREREVPFVIVGGIALLAYVAGRNTQDLDLIIAYDAVNALPGVEILSSDENFARLRFRALQVDALLTTNPLFHVVQQQHSTEYAFGEGAARVATPEGIILLKLYALPSLYCQGDLARVAIYEADIETLLPMQSHGADELLARLRAFVSATDLAVLKDILEDINRRLERFRRLSPE